MWKKLAISAVAILGMAAPALADENRGGYHLQPTYVQPAHPSYAQPTFQRDARDDYWRMRQWRRWQRMKRFERMRYEHRW